MNETQELTTFDIPETVKDFLAVAVETETIRPIDLFTLAVNHGVNYLTLVKEVNEIAYCNIHWNGEAHSKVVRAAEKVWQELL